MFNCTALRDDESKRDQLRRQVQGHLSSTQLTHRPTRQPGHTTFAVQDQCFRFDMPIRPPVPSVSSTPRVPTNLHINTSLGLSSLSTGAGQLPTPPTPHQGAGQWINSTGIPIWNAPTPITPLFANQISSIVLNVGHNGVDNSSNTGFQAHSSGTIGWGLQTAPSLDLAIPMQGTMLPLSPSMSEYVNFRARVGSGTQSEVSAASGYNTAETPQSFWFANQVFYRGDYVAVRVNGVEYYGVIKEFLTGGLSHTNGMSEYDPQLLLWWLTRQQANPMELHDNWTFLPVSDDNVGVMNMSSIIRVLFSPMSCTSATTPSAANGVIGFTHRPSSPNADTLVPAPGAVLSSPTATSFHRSDFGQANTVTLLDMLQFFQPKMTSMSTIASPTAFLMPTACSFYAPAVNMIDAAQDNGVVVQRLTDHHAGSLAGASQFDIRHGVDPSIPSFNSSALLGLSGSTALQTAVHPSGSSTVDSLYQLPMQLSSGETVFTEPPAILASSLVSADSPSPQIPHWIDARSIVGSSPTLTGISPTMQQEFGSWLGDVEQTLFVDGDQPMMQDEPDFLDNWADNGTDLGDDTLNPLGAGILLMKAKAEDRAITPATFGRMMAKIVASNVYLFSKMFGSSFCEWIDWMQEQNSEFLRKHLETSMQLEYLRGKCHFEPDRDHSSTNTVRTLSPKSWLRRLTPRLQAEMQTSPRYERFRKVKTLFDRHFLHQPLASFASVRVRGVLNAAVRYAENAGYAPESYGWCPLTTHHMAELYPFHICSLSRVAAVLGEQAGRVDRLNLQEIEGWSADDMDDLTQEWIVQVDAQEARQKFVFGCESVSACREVGAAGHHRRSSEVPRTTTLSHPLEPATHEADHRADVQKSENRCDERASSLTLLATLASASSDEVEAITSAASAISERSRTVSEDSMASSWWSDTAFSSDLLDLFTSELVQQPSESGFTEFLSATMGIQSQAMCETAMHPQQYPYLQQDAPQQQNGERSPVSSPPFAESCPEDQQRLHTIPVQPALVRGPTLIPGSEWRTIFSDSFPFAQAPSSTNAYSFTSSTTADDHREVYMELEHVVCRVVSQLMVDYLVTVFQTAQRWEGEGLGVGSSSASASSAAVRGVAGGKRLNRRATGKLSALQRKLNILQYVKSKIVWEIHRRLQGGGN